MVEPAPSAKGKRKKRSRNWDTVEVEILTKAVTACQDILFSKLNDRVSSQRKDGLWKQIACKINEVNRYKDRDYRSVKHKWGVIASNTKGVEITRRVFTDESTTKAGMLLLRTDESTTKAGMLLHSVLGTPLLDALNNQLLDVEGLSPNNFSTLMAYPEDSKDSSLNIPSLYTSPIETPWDSKRDVTTMTNNLITRTQSTECGSAEKANFNTAEKVECKPDFNSLVVDALLGIKRELSDIKDMEAKRLKIEERKLALMELTRIDS